MRLRASLTSILAAGAAAVLAVTGWTFAASGAAPLSADKSPNALPVDVELVLAVDVSYSMDPEEQALQRVQRAERPDSGHNHARHQSRLI